MDTNLIFTSLNNELSLRNISRDLIICGGAALIALQVVRRGTKDVDVLIPKIDSELHGAAEAVAEKLKLAKNWLNNGPALLVKELPHGWESQCALIFEGSHLKIKAIGRRDLIYSKLYAAADRTDDIDDLVALKPTSEELEEARKLVLLQDASKIWPQIVEECLVEVRKRLNYEK